MVQVVVQVVVQVQVLVGSSGSGSVFVGFNPENPVKNSDIFKLQTFKLDIIYFFYVTV